MVIHRATCMGWWFCNSAFVSCWKLSWVVFNLISGEVINIRLEGLKPYDQQKMTRCFLFFFTCSTIKMGWYTTKGKLIWDWLERPISVSRLYWYGFDDSSWLMTDLCNDDWHVNIHVHEVNALFKPIFNLPSTFCVETCLGPYWS